VLDLGLLFVKPASGWEQSAPISETATLVASDGLPEDIFGYAVAISGDTVVVGVPDAGKQPRRRSVCVRQASRRLGIYNTDS
jgi:hypothetical protein